MSDIIHLLPDSVANQIAAGEVIQRPSSVIKELIENSIDAEATLIQVYVTEAGKSIIQVSDNGKGMSETDARLAFERHSTSKISSAEDLFSLKTMGFRGEALASISAVGQVELRTRTKDVEIGTSIIIHGGKLKEQQVVNCPIGANFIVKNLFFNIPARRKFLKSNQTELSNIIQEFERIALAHPEISFKLYSNDTLLLELEKGNFKQRIRAIFGRKLDQQLLPLNVETELGNLSGFVGMPTSSKKKGVKQFFFVNGRFMRHPYFSKAVLSAYDRLIPEGDQVPYFINFKVDPNTIDVNIHPTKTEIKFQDEQTHWQIILAAVKEALAKYNSVPTLDFDVENKPSIPIFNPSLAPQNVRLNLDKGYNPFKDTFAEVKNWQDAYEKALGKNISQEINIEKDALIEENQLFVANKVNNDCIINDEILNIEENQYFLYKGRYLVIKINVGILVLDQRRAHIRILYEDYLSKLEKQEGVSQGLLFPEIIHFNPSQIPLIEDILPSLKNIGFDLRKKTNIEYEIKGIPSGTEGLDPIVLLTQIIDAIFVDKKDIYKELNHNIALNLAQCAALPIGEILSLDQVKSLIKQLLSKTIPNYTPQGKIIFTIFSESQIDDIFK